MPNYGDVGAIDDERINGDTLVTVDYTTNAANEITEIDYANPAGSDVAIRAFDAEVGDVYIKMWNLYSSRRALILAILIATALSIWLIFQLRSPLPFDSRRWKSNDLRIRGRMIEHSDFVSQVRNMTRKEILEQLGPPNIMLDYKNKDNSERFMYEYCLPFDLFDSWFIVDIREDRIFSLATLQLLDSDPQPMLDSQDLSDHD